MSTIEEIQQKMQVSIYDPNMIQVESLNLLEKSLDGNADIPDPTNPFTFLLENFALVTSSALKEVTVNMRKSYPELATTKNDLYGFINSSEVNNMFATPSKCSFNIFIKIKDMETFSYVTNAYKKIVIPKFSNIEIDNTIFTLLNDISIFLYNDGRVFAKYDYNNIDISLNTDTVINSSVVTDSDDISWILLDLTIDQIKIYNFKETLFKSDVFRTTAYIGDNEFFTYVTAKSIDPKTSTVIPLKTTFSNFVFNPDTPTLIVRPSDNSIEFELPYIYNLDNNVSSNVNFNLYTTNGNISKPLNKYDTTDFVFNVVMPTTTDASIIGLQNIAIKVNSSSYTYGGIDEIDFLTMKNKILNYSTGDNNLPITLSEIVDKAKTYGFVFKKYYNKISNNEILLTKDIGDLGYNVDTTINIVGSSVKIQTSSISSDKIKTIGNDVVIIEPFQLFEILDGIPMPLSNADTTIISNISDTDILEYNKRKIMFNLYRYILDYGDVLSVRAYDVNSPSISNPTSIYTTTGLYTPIVITDRTIIKTLDGYKIYITMASNSGVDKVDLTELFIQLKIKVSNNDILLYKGIFTRDDNNNLLATINIETDTYIDKDDKILFKNSLGKVLSSKVNLNNIVNAIIYTTNTAITESSSYDNSRVLIDNNVFTLYEEDYSFKLAVPLKNLYGKYDITYTDRKFETYTEVVYKTYTEDVYEMDTSGTIKIIPIDTNGDNINDDITINKIHSTGEIMKDGNGVNIILHNIGDIKLDVYDKPIINPLVGVIHDLDILLLDDKFLRATEDTIRRYRVDFFLRLTEIISKEINDINDKLIENSIAYYTPNLTTNNVILTLNETPKKYSSVIKPIVTIYISKDTSIKIDDITKGKITITIQSMLYNNVKIGDIENSIKDLISDDVLSISLTGITDDNLVVINYAEGSSRFYIDKFLEKNENSDVVVTPNVKININTI